MTYCTTIERCITYFRLCPSLQSLSVRILPLIQIYCLDHSEKTNVWESERRDVYLNANPSPSVVSPYP